MIASDRLGMETAIDNIRIFFLTIGTHKETAHRCLRTVVRKVPDNRETRATMRTINKRISDSMGLRSPVSHTIRTNSDIRGDLRDLIRF